MKFKFWRRRVAVSSPRMKITTQLPWPIRMGHVIVAALIGAALMWCYDTGRLSSNNHLDDPRQQLADYKDQLEKYKAERDQYSTVVNASESEINIERSAQKQLAIQVKSLEQENTELKEDLAFFESLLPNATGSHGITIRRVKIDQIAS